MHTYEITVDLSGCGLPAVVDFPRHPTRRRVRRRGLRDDSVLEQRAFSRRHPDTGDHQPDGALGEAPILADGESVADCVGRLLGEAGGDGADGSRAPVDVAGLVRASEELMRIVAGPADGFALVRLLKRIAEMLEGRAAVVLAMTASTSIEAAEKADADEAARRAGLDVPVPPAPGSSEEEFDRYWALVDAIGPDRAYADPSDVAAVEVLSRDLASATGVTRNHAQSQVATAMHAARWFPQRLQGLLDGSVRWGDVKRVVDASAEHLVQLEQAAGTEKGRAGASPADVAAAIDAKVLARAAASGNPMPFRQVRERVTRLVARMDAKAQSRRHARAAGNRGVFHTDNADGTTTVSWVLTTPDAIMVRAAIDRAVRIPGIKVPVPAGVLACIEAQALLDEACGKDFAEAVAEREEKDSKRHHYSRMASDLLAHLALGGTIAGLTGNASLGGAGTANPSSAGASLGNAHSVTGPSGHASLGDASVKDASTRPVLDVAITMSLDTLVGLADDPATGPHGQVIPADIARELARDARWKRIVTDPVTGHVLDEGAARFPSEAMKRLVRSRYATCTAPGCASASRRCDIDHAVEHRHGGTTTPSNLHPASRRCHTLKSLGQYTVTIGDDGDVTWASTLTGHRHTTKAQTHGQD